MLAKELADHNDEEGIRIIAEHLWDKNKNIQSDCLKVLYELGMLKPVLIGGLYTDFLKILKLRNNRMLWGAMIALSTIADIKADELFPHIDQIKSSMLEGSVITVDNGVKTLALIGSKNSVYRNEILPFLFDHLKTCRPKDVPQHAEHTSIAIDRENKKAFVSVLEERIPDLSSSGLIRIKKVIKKLAAV